MSLQPQPPNGSYFFHRWRLRTTDDLCITKQFSGIEPGDQWRFKREYSAAKIVDRMSLNL